jgi:hypothetical protein
MNVSMWPMHASNYQVCNGVMVRWCVMVCDGVCACVMVCNGV